MGIKIVDGVIHVTDTRKNILGWKANGEEILRSSRLGDIDFEDYLLFYCTTRWQKFRAKYFRPVYLGFLKKFGHDVHMDWYLFWCGTCQHFVVSYKHGYEGRLDCKSCIFKSYP